MLTTWQYVKIVVVYMKAAQQAHGDAWNAFVRASEANFLPGKNPFTPEEVCTMWHAHIAALALEGRVSCESNMRPHLDPDFNLKYPPSQTVLVYPKVGAAESAADVARERGIGIALGREVRFVQPDFMLHNTEIRSRVTTAEDWEQYLAEGVYETFLGLRGPERMRSVQSK